MVTKKLEINKFYALIVILSFCCSIPATFLAAAQVDTSILTIASHYQPDSPIRVNYVNVNDTQDFYIYAKILNASGIDDVAHDDDSFKVLLCADSNSQAGFTLYNDSAVNMDSAPLAVYTGLNSSDVIKYFRVDGRTIFKVNDVVTYNETENLLPSQDMDNLQVTIISVEATDGLTVGVYTVPADESITPTPTATAEPTATPTYAIWYHDRTQVIWLIVAVIIVVLFVMFIRSKF